MPSLSLIKLQKDDNDDIEDIETLRRIAMESINCKKAKDEQQQQQQQQLHMQPAYQSQPIDNAYVHHPVAQFNSFPPAYQPRMTNYMAPRYIPAQNSMNFGPPYVPPFHPRSIQPSIHQDFNPIPHVNPQFMAQQPMPLYPNEYPPPIMDYVPTPAIRLSPRSLE